MRRIGIALAVVLVFGFTPALMAQTYGNSVRVAGQLTKIDGKALTITSTVNGAATDTVVTCNSATNIARDSAPSTLLKFEELTVGMQVRAYCTKADMIAQSVHIADAKPPTPTVPAVRVAGQLTKIDGKALTITSTVNGAATDTVITCNSATNIARDSAPSTLLKFEELTVGMQVRTYCTKDGMIAGSIHIADAKPPTPKPSAIRVADQLTRIDGKTLTITTTANGAATDTAITCNDATKFSRDGDKYGVVTFADLRAGQQVRAYYNLSDHAALAVMIAGGSSAASPK